MKIAKSKLLIIRIAFFWTLIFGIISCKDSKSIKTNSEDEIHNKQKSIVVLTYDDALDVHLDNVIPLLDSVGLTATFYLNTGAESVSKRRSEWAIAASLGHELGNHTVHHPCIGESLNRKWVDKDKDLDYYTIDKIVSEIKEANDTLEAIDSKPNRTYAYTCGDTTADHRSYVKELQSLFPSARGVVRANNDIDSLDLFHLKAYSINGHTFTDLKAAIDLNHKEGGLLIFLMHGVGGGHDLNIDLEEHEKLIDYLNDKRDSIWITTMIEAVEFVETNK